jgi:hypothetical protein
MPLASVMSESAIFPTVAGGKNEPFSVGLLARLCVLMPQPESQMISAENNMTKDKNLAIVFDDILHVYYRTERKG